MGQIRQINGVYYIEFYARGLLYSQIAGPHLEEAQRLLEEVEKKIAGGEALTVTRHIELPDFFERFKKYAHDQYGPQSVCRFDHLISHFSIFLNKDFPYIHQLAQLTPAVIESYKLHLAKSCRPKITNFTILLTRDMLEFGIKLGFINDNPSLHLRLLPWPKATLRKPTARYLLAQQLLPKGVGASKTAQLLGFSDVSRIIFYAHLIPLSREDMLG